MTVKTGLCWTWLETQIVVFFHVKAHVMSQMKAFEIQYNLIITLSLGSTETDCVISELCYNEVIHYMEIEKYSFGIQMPLKDVEGCENQCLQNFVII